MSNKYLQRRQPHTSRSDLCIGGIGEPKHAHTTIDPSRPCQRLNSLKAICPILGEYTF